MNTQFDYQLIVMHHQQLLVEAEPNRWLHEASRQPSRLKVLWAGQCQRISRLRAQNRAAIRQSLRERSA